MKPALHVLDGGAFTTVQDLGRYGAQSLGVPVSGALDPVSLRLGNALVGNPQGCAGLEIRLLGPRLRVEDAPGRVALVGTAAPLEILEPAPAAVPSGQSTTLQPGTVFRIGATRDTGTCMLAITGGFDFAPVLGSQSTYVPARLGGFRGRALRAGDRIALAHPAPDGPERQFGRGFALPNGTVMRVVPGPQDDRFTEEAMETLLSRTYAVSQSSNRMGLLLDGPPLAHAGSHDIASDGIVAGAIQVPGDGKPIVLLADRQTTGGYPKIGTVISADVPRLGRMRAGEQLSFEAVDVATAESLRRAQESWLQDVIGSFETVPTSHEALTFALRHKNLISGAIAGDEPH